MIISPRIRASLHWVGGSLSLIGLIFLGFRLQSYWDSLDLSSVTTFDWCLLGLFSVIYGAANFLLAFAWWQLLCHLGAPAKRLGSIKIYGISQLGKYAPGNIFHIAGRQALGMAAGIPASALAKSVIWELCLIATAGALFCWLILPLLWPDTPFLVSMTLLLCTTVLTTGILRKQSGGDAARAFVLQFSFLIVSGGIFVATLCLIASNKDFESWQWATIGSAYIVAWLVGLLTPGAPAGLGVREMILLVLLGGQVAEQDLLIAVLLGRLVTVSGDLLFFISTFLVGKQLDGSDKQRT